MEVSGLGCILWEIAEHWVEVMTYQKNLKQINPCQLIWQQDTLLQETLMKQLDAGVIR